MIRKETHKIKVRYRTRCKYAIMRMIIMSETEYFIKEEPFYLPQGNEIEVFETAFKEKLPVMLKGPTGCGKTRFLEYMAYKLNLPLITVACNEDLTASDLVGRFILKGDETVWQDGPLTLGARMGAITYLDEIVEARKDTMVVIHPLTDHRRILPIDKLGTQLKAHDNFMLVISYNPGYQSVLKELKQSTKQRFLSINFKYPPPELEEKIVMIEGGVDKKTARTLVEIGNKIRNLKEQGLEEGVSTRLLIYAAKLIKRGIRKEIAYKTAMLHPLTDDEDMKVAINEIFNNYL